MTHDVTHSLGKIVNISGVVLLLPVRDNSPIENKILDREFYWRPEHESHCGLGI